MREPTREEAAIFDFYFDLDIDTWQCYDLYHYRSTTSLIDIAQPEELHLRLTRADRFSDKTEGKVVETFYAVALQEMLADGEITESQYSTLMPIRPLNKAFFSELCADGLHHGEWTEYDPYIICFSTVENDEKMFRQIGKGQKDAFCLHFISETFRKLSHDDIEKKRLVSLTPILYERDAVNYLKDWIQRIATDENLLKSAENLMADVLFTVQYSAKKAEFSHENEVRLIVKIPKGHQLEQDVFEKPEHEEDPYLRLCIQKAELYGITAGPENKIQSTIELSKLLQSRGYEEINITKRSS